MSDYAFVIHKQWSGETSARVVFFTKERGLISCLCKGGRTPQKQGLLQAFTPLWVLFTERAGYYYVQKIELQAPPLSLSSYYLFAALYVNELLYHALRPLDEQSTLFSAYEHTLLYLSKAETHRDIEVILRRFEWALLVSMGYAMSLTEDPRSQLSIDAARYYALIVGEGFVASEKGILGAHLLAMAIDNFDDPAVLKSAKWIMRHAIQHALGGKVIQARQLYR